MADLITMLSAVAGQQGEEADEDFNQTVLLLHGDGTNGAQNNTFLDSSTNNFTITRNGNTTQGTFSPFSVGAGQWSNYFDGSGDRLTLSSNTAFEMGTGDFTIECWAYPVSFGNGFFLYVHWNGSGVAGTPRFGIGLTATGVTVDSANGLALTFSGSTTVALNAWYHVAFVRNGNSFKTYINGTEISSATSSNTYAPTGHPLSIGDYIDDYGTGYGYISNLRVVKGTAVYTSNFTPPTAPLTAISGTSLLTCQSNRFVDNSTNAFAITRNGDVRVTPFSPFAPTAAYSANTNGGSGYFDNTGDYLTVPSNAAYRIELNSTWTWECWVYPVTLAATDVLTGNTTNASSTGHVFYLANGLLRLVQYGVSDFASTATVLVNQWNHLAAVSNANSLTFYINGVTAGTQTWGSGTAGGAMNIGSGYTGADLFNGYMAGLRYVVGSAITPASGGPTQPPTNITNTSLLLNFTNAGIIDNTGKNNLETVGNAQIDTAVKKYGTGSLEFDGNGDFLSIFATAELQLTNASAFTIEFWVYAATLPSIGGSAFIIRAYNLSSPFQGYGIAFGGNTANTNLQLWNGTAWADIGTVSTTTWTHVAIAYEGSGSTLRYFINGTQQGSATTVPSSINWTGTQFILGARNSDFYFNGYIDDLRITKGVARYTANFTPPTKAFPDQ